MTRSILLAIAVGFVAAVAVAGQSVVITKKKTVYTRPKPIVDFKKTFVVHYPRVKASTPALSRKIESTISYLKVMDLNIREEISDVQWLEEADFEVNYNSRGILVVTLTINGTAAYPDGTSKTVVVDQRTGNRILPETAFTDLAGLAVLIKQKQKEEIEKSIKELKADPENKEIDPAELFENTDFKIDDLKEYAVDNETVTFIYDYGFPHVIEALQPEGRFTFKWTEIARFVKPGGPFAKFIVR